ncbi:MAG: TetR/AcrR family transcriptional regulator [Rhizobiales bacterium]|nr:TetR/AcrR family transcriptional regulator [Hyphomicrobiales bacterium]
MPRSVKSVAPPAAVPTAPGGEAGLPDAPRFVDLLKVEADAPGLRKGERTRRLARYATARCLEQATFAQLSMDQIAVEAGVSRAAIYQYFRSKEDAVRDVMTDFHDRTIAFPRTATQSLTPFDAIYRTNRYYIDYFARNAVLMERVRELRDALPELLRERQRINASWAQRILANVMRQGPLIASQAAIELRIVCLECMVDDVLREAFVIGNPALATARDDPNAFAREITAIWYRAIYPTQDDARG